MSLESKFGRVISLLKNHNYNLNPHYTTQAVIGEQATIVSLKAVSSSDIVTTITAKLQHGPVDGRVKLIVASSPQCVPILTAIYDRAGYPTVTWNPTVNGQVYTSCIIDFPRSRFDRVNGIVTLILAGVTFQDGAYALVDYEYRDGDRPSAYIEPEMFIAAVKAMGGTSEELLRGLRYEDIEKCLPDIQIGDTIVGGFGHTAVVKPVILAREIAKVFRGSSDDLPSSLDKRVVSSVRAERMTARELIVAFDPEEADNAVGKRLREMSRGEPFIVYSTGRIVDIETSARLLAEVKSGYHGRGTVDVNGVIGVRVYRIGELPNNYVDENPVFVGRPLRPDGTCDQTGRSWDGVVPEVRQFVRLVVEYDGHGSSLQLAHDLMDGAVMPGAMGWLRNRYRSIAVKFDEAQRVGTLPKLRVVLASTDHGSPFTGGRQVTVK